MENTFLRKIKFAKKYLLGSEFHNEHFDAAIEILDIMASKEPHTNHIILDAPTQSGKTSVMEMVYRVLNFEQINKFYGIEQVIYMTADNGSGEGSLKFQTIDRFKNHWKNYVHSIPIDFLKRSDFDKFNHVMDNTLIMVDESQYGWREVYSKGQRILQVNGINFCSVEELQKRNTYILSVSATTQNERYGDSELKLKPIVRLKTGKGYLGFEDFFNSGIVKSVKKEDFIDNYEKLNNFLEKQYKRLNAIYKKTNVAKCVILRLVDNKRKGFLTDSEEFSNIVEANGFTHKLIISRDSKIDYVSLQSNIYYNCNNFNENGKKFYLVVIKYAFSYGITIDTKVKKLIGTCYDVRKDTNSTEATEQGLMGRMSGYGCTLEDFEDLEIYVNETHYNGIKECVINNANEYSRPLKSCSKTIRVKCEKKESNAIVLFNNNERKPLEFKGEIVDDWIKKNKKELDFKPLFGEENIAAISSKPYLRIIAEKFLKDIGVFDKMGFGDDFFDSRRKRSDRDMYAERMCTDNPLLTNGCRSVWQTEEKAKKGVICWGALFDITKADKKTMKGLIIRIPYGSVGFAKTIEVSSLKMNKGKMWSGYNTNITNNTVVTPRVVV